jgi:hypothetical protein
MIELNRSTAVLLALTLTAAAQAPAQDWSSAKALPVGTEVRISAGSRTVSGQIQSVTDDALTVNSGKGQEMFARQEIARVSVRKRGHRGRNALIGLAVGAGAGAAIGAATDTTGCKGSCIFQVSKGEAAGVGAAVFGAIGALVGAVIPTGGWREVYKK